MKKINTLVNWLLLIAGAAIDAGILDYMITAAVHSSKQWQGYRVHYYYETLQILGYIGLGIIVLIGIKMIIIAVSTKPESDKSQTTATQSASADEQHK